MNTDDEILKNTGYKKYIYYDPVFLRNEVKSRFLVKNNTTQITR